MSWKFESFANQRTGACPCTCVEAAESGSGLIRTCVRKWLSASTRFSATLKPARANRQPRRQGVRAQFSKLRRRVLKKRDVQSLYSIFRFGINKCSAADAILHIRRTPANISPKSTAAIHVSLRYRRAAPIRGLPLPLFCEKLTYAGNRRSATAAAKTTRSGTAMRLSSFFSDSSLNLRIPMISPARKNSCRLTRQSAPKRLYDGSALRTYGPGHGQFRGCCSDTRRFIQRRDFRVNVWGFRSYFPPTESSFL
jgi:hypothetical protein